MLQATTEINAAEPRPISEILAELLPKSHLRCVEFNSEINSLKSSGRSSWMGSRSGQILNTGSGLSSGNRLVST